MPRARPWFRGVVRRADARSGAASPGYLVPGTHEEAQEPPGPRLPRQLVVGRAGLPVGAQRVGPGARARRRVGAGPAVAHHHGADLVGVGVAVAVIRRVAAVIEVDRDADLAARAEHVA